MSGEEGGKKSVRYRAPQKSKEEYSKKKEKKRKKVGILRKKKGRRRREGGGLLSKPEDAPFISETANASPLSPPLRRHGVANVRAAVWHLESGVMRASGRGSFVDVELTD